jgi:HEPN domain-containing protein
MELDRTKTFWLEEAEEAKQVAEHLFEKKDYSYSLFFGHLAIEKLLKALYVTRKAEQAPYIHNLLRLAESIGLSLTDEQRDDLIRITVFHLESRYPDEKRSFRNKCTRGYTKKELTKIDGVFAWLISMLE